MSVKEEPPHILLVDDDNDFRSLVRSTLLDEGFDVDDVGNGKLALAKLKEKTYDVVLLDIKMPEMDGLETLRQARPGAPTTDFVMITGFQDITIAVESIKLGAREYLTKPVEPDALIQRIHSIVRAHVAETRLREVQAEFNSRLLYDVRNPVVTVKSAIGFLLKGMAGPLTEQHSEVLNHMDFNIGKVLSILNDMIDLDQFESGRVRLEKLPTNLDDLVPAICGQMEPLAHAKQLTLSVNTGPGIPTIELDAEKIEQVITNLLDNAIKYTPEKGKIAVQMKLVSGTVRNTPQECVEITVSDTGTGIPADELPYVFNKHKEFLTGKASAKKSTGLGLAICRGIVEAHNGAISVRSEHGKGSTFSVLLPIEQSR